MEPIKSSMQGGTPALAVAAVDPGLPTCGAVSKTGHVCTRGQGHGDYHYAPQTVTNDAAHWYEDAR